MTWKPPVAGPRFKRLKLTLGMLLGGIAVVAVCLAARNMIDQSASAGTPAIPFLRSTPRTAEATPSRASAGPQTRIARQPAEGRPQGGASSAAAGGSPPEIVATVNRQDITRDELAAECLRHYGNEVLESLVNKFLIQQECQQRGIAVTPAEVNAEIKRMAEWARLPVDQWLELIENERGIQPEQYADDIIWTILALRKLAGSRLEVTQQELAEQFDSQYGEAVKARLIVCDDRATAEEVRAEAAAHPDRFGPLAKEKSVDAPSASLNGLVRPIRRHAGPKEIEQVAFQMRDGEVSPVIPVSGQYVILKREGIQPGMRVSFEQVKMNMIEVIRDRKMRQAANDVFQRLQNQARVEDVWNDPAERAQMPGVAAVVNGHRVTLRELAGVCIQRHGEEVLEGTINRRLLEQALRKRKLTVTDDDLDEEIARAASEMLPLKADGSPDVEKWLATVTEQQNISVDVYRSDAVWPSVALKKLVGQTVEVTEEDLRKGFEANFGPRVRCLAIVLDDLRRAQKVWDLARSDPTPENFGDLAAQYSIDPSSRSLRGEVPPIQKHGGQPNLEEEAFALKPGELSRIIQVAGTNTYVILLCEGLTKPVHVDLATVRDEIYADLHEKKLRVAMADYFEELQKSASIDNYLAGSVQRPRQAGTSGATAKKPATRSTTPKR